MTGMRARRSTVRGERVMERGSWGFMLAVAVGACAAAGPARAEDAPRRRVVAGEHYKASGLHRFLFGADYRDLWTTPVELPVLDLQRYAGGLKPVRRVGGQETKGLA